MHPSLMNSNLLIPDYYVGDDITSLGEDLLVNLIVLVNLFADGKPDLLKLSELEALAQDGVDLKFSLLRAFG